MSTENICRFIPNSSENEKLHVINFVLEAKEKKFNGLTSSSIYQMYYVKCGEGFLHTSQGKYKLGAGDIFFTFPGSPFAIESVSDFEYMYISYLGARGNKICESLKINRHNCVFNGFSEAESVWMSSLLVPKEAADLRVESVLLYTFSLLAERFLPQANEVSSDGTALLIKKHIDDNLSDYDLSLEKIGDELSYNPKYISTVFKKKMGLGVSEYIATVRIQHACTLMEQGFTSIKDISAMCGFKDSLYFSKVFKKKMGHSPKEHISDPAR